MVLRPLREFKFHSVAWWGAKPQLTRALLYIIFQFEVSLRKTAQHLVRLPPKTLPKPQSQHPFCGVKLRHVDRMLPEMKPQPQPESADRPASSSPSCRSAIHFMTRVLQRLREVDEHVSEVITICLSIIFLLHIFNFSSVLFSYPCDCCMSWSPKMPLSECWLYIMHWLYI